ncbi:hypothetical protein HPB47_027066 [Ixodes persulcatus]|uniref:Uncharacterized protein n=1 Tax=Ixodes persulcatus TaxID=34615 RepID=A0AC60PYJ2_IXOPE|nr:hypothetical protein HPB47_027066 [Ixodes persulcatus]
MWRTFKGLNNKKKAKKTGESIALRQEISEQELAATAGSQLFPPDNNKRPLEDKPEYSEATPMDALFNMGDLVQALAKARNTTPGPDRSTVAALRNLPEKGKEQLLEVVNKDNGKNESPAYSPFQTGFRPSLSTTESIALIHKDVLSKQPSNRPKTVVAINLKKAFDSVPHWAVIRGAINRGLRAILMEVENSDPQQHCLVYTDSKAAYEECRNPSTSNKTAKAIKARVINRQTKLSVRWIPGHQNIPGNEAAHAAARAMLSSPSSDPGYGDLTCSSEKQDPTALKDDERTERRERLYALTKQDLHPLPDGPYSRWDRVCFRRLRTGTAMVPKRTAMYALNKQRLKRYNEENSDPADDMDESLCRHYKAGSAIYPVAVSSSLIIPEVPSYVALEGDPEAASPAEAVLVAFCLYFIFNFE